MSAPPTTEVQVAPRNEFGFDHPAPGPDWGVLALLGSIILVFAVLSSLISWILHQYRGERRLRWRAAHAAAVPVISVWSLMIAVFAIAEKQPIDRAIRQVFSMPGEAWAFFACMFVACYLAAAAIGWWLRRRVARSNHIDPAVFG